MMLERKIDEGYQPNEVEKGKRSFISLIWNYFSLKNTTNTLEPPTLHHTSVAKISN